MTSGRCKKSKASDFFVIDVGLKGKPILNEKVREPMKPV